MDNVVNLLRYKRFHPEQSLHAFFTDILAEVDEISNAIESLTDYFVRCNSIEQAMTTRALMERLEMQADDLMKFHRQVFNLNHAAHF